MHLKSNCVTCANPCRILTFGQLLSTNILHDKNRMDFGANILFIRWKHPILNLPIRSFFQGNEKVNEPGEMQTNAMGLHREVS